MRNRQNVQLEKTILDARKAMESLRAQMKIAESAVREIESRLIKSQFIAEVRPRPAQAARLIKEEHAAYQGLFKNRRSSDKQENLRKLRGLKAAFDLTHGELAGLVGVSERTIFNWMSGEATLSRLARAKTDRLFRVYETAAKEIKPEALRRWLFAQNELLGGRIYDLLMKGEFEKVLADIEALREGVHV